MSPAVVSATDGGTQRYNLEVSSMQDNIQISDNAITGTLKKVQKFPGFGDDEANNPNYYLALDVTVPEGATVETKIEGGKNKGYVDLTTDKFCVYRIRNKDTQKIQIKTTVGSQSTTQVYSLAGLKLSGN